MDDLPEETWNRLEREKLASLYQFAYGLSHEINNPLTNISARAQNLLASEKDPARRRALAMIHLQALRAYEMIADLMLFARPPAPIKAEVELKGLISKVVREWQSAADEQGTELVWSEEGAALFAWVDPAQIAVALGALVRNSLEAIGHGGLVSIRLTATPAGGATISVVDTGPGISPEIRRHLFDPYFSGREAGRGLGLGLSKCWRIVEQHLGEISVESPLGGGAEFTIRIPAREEPSRR